MAITLRKANFLDLIFPHGMFVHIRFFSPLSYAFFALSMTPLRFLSPIKYTAFNVYENNIAVGSAYLTQKGKKAELAIGLFKNYRSKGYGTMLLKAIMKDNNGRVQIYLKVDKNNKIAQKFFKKHGFKGPFDNMVLERNN